MTHYRTSHDQEIELGLRGALEFAERSIETFEMEKIIIKIREALMWLEEEKKKGASRYLDAPDRKEVSHRQPSPKKILPPPKFLPRIK